jgi:RNA polymerase sigma-70 factor (ECF subfamily)
MEGISVSGMKTRVQRGRRMMRALFEECCHLSIDARGKVFAIAPKPRCGCER